MAVDIIMAVSDEDGNWLAAESQTAFRAEYEKSRGSGKWVRDELAQDLEQGKLFEVDDFSLGIGLEDRDEADENSNENKLFARRVREFLEGQKATSVLVESRETMANSVASRLQKKGKRKFDKWLNGQDNSVKAGVPTSGYPLDFQAFEFTRQLDQASIDLFDACCNSLTLKKAAMLKRKVTGIGQTQTYLRIDFTDILITSLDWDVDDTVKEKVKFICRGATVRYRQQLATGDLGPSQQVEWEPRHTLFGGKAA